jgi:hypothetical protein
VQYDLSIQTLAILDLQDSRMGVEGVRYLAHSLQNNTVKKVAVISILYLFLSIIIETCRTRSLG